MHLTGAQGTAGRRHADPFQRVAHPRLKPAFDQPRHTTHLLDIFDLPVNHRALFVLCDFHGAHLKPLAPGQTHNADDAAGANIQRKHIVFRRDFLSGIRGRQTCLVFFLHEKDLRFFCVRQI